MEPLVIRMTNVLSFSRWENPAVPVHPARSGGGALPPRTTETIIVTLRDDILSISEAGLFGTADNDFLPDVQDAVHALHEFAANFRIYARRESEEGGRMRFRMVESPRDVGVRAVRPFPVLQDPKPHCELWREGETSPWRLYAYGTDDGSGNASRRGWIFDATEIEETPAATS